MYPFLRLVSDNLLVLALLVGFGCAAGQGSRTSQAQPAQVLVTGGNRSSGQVLASAGIYDPATGTFRRTGRMTMIRHKHAATALRDGKVLITGGSDARDGRGRYTSAEVFDPTSGTFTAVNAMPSASSFRMRWFCCGQGRCWWPVATSGWRCTTLQPTRSAPVTGVWGLISRSLRRHSSPMDKC